MNDYINLDKFNAAYYSQEVKTRGYIERDRLNLNWSNIQDKLVRLAAKYTDSYASDLIISLNTIQRCLQELQIPKVWYFGFRESGVDHDNFITSKRESELRSEYRAVWRLTLTKIHDEYADNAVEMSLHKLEYYYFRKVGENCG